MTALTPRAAYDLLVARCREVALLGSTTSLLHWDQETYLPARGVPYRAEQIAYMAGKIHVLASAPEIGDWLAACESAENGATLAENAEAEAIARANVRELRHDYDRTTKLPLALVEELARASSLGREAWVQARKESNFSIFQASLEKLLDLTRRQADFWGYQETPYDALLEGYEPGARASYITPLFADLRAKLLKLLPGAIMRTNAVDPNQVLKGEYPRAAQQAFNAEVAAAIGFDFDAGRIDTTTHPFCTEIGPRDCRLTTRYDETDFASSLFGVMHEAGHGMYDQGLVESQYGLPLGASVSLGIHESQSRLWENQVGRSMAFWKHWYPRAQEIFPRLREVPVERFWLAINHVEPSFIRVESDEVTYNLHIMLRYEIERQLIEGKLKVADVPKAWNEMFHHDFGLEVPNDAQGCLQDVHWSGGGFGYFPTYTLGNLNSAQLLNAARKKVPTLEADLARGKYASLLAWLRENVHAPGRRLSPNALMEAATGEPTKAQYFTDYLEQKFGPSDRDRAVAMNVESVA